MSNKKKVLLLSYLGITMICDFYFFYTVFPLSCYPAIRPDNPDLRLSGPIAENDLDRLDTEQFPDISL